MRLAAFMVLAGGLVGFAGVPFAGSGRLPIVELDFRDRTEHVVLEADYGYIVDWPKGKDPVFFLFDSARQRRARITHWSTFLEELRSLPDGAHIDAVGKCTVGFAWAMPKSKWTELSDVLKEKRFRVASMEDQEKHVQFCYCVTRGFKILYDETR